MNVKFGKDVDSAHWIKDSFSSYLDDYGQAHVSLNDFMEFLEAFEINLGVKKEARDTEAKLKEKDRVQPQDYKVTQADFFRGCSTILNSETAALSVAQTLMKECEAKNCEWLDPDFGPKNKADKKGSLDAIYFPGLPKSKALPNHDMITWMRPEEFIDDKTKKGQFLSGDAGSNDVCQGQIGDCWFIGAMSVLATRDELLYGGAATAGGIVRPGMMIDKNMAKMFSEGVYPPIFHKFRTRKIYILRFFKEFAWRYVIIDDQLPCFSGNSSLVFAKCQETHELWVPLIEKAYAKLFGCYQTLISGFIDDGLHDMTSFVCEKKKLHDAKGFFDESYAEEFWQNLQECRENGCLMGCSSNGATEREVVIDGERTGIMSGHAYGLNDVFTIET
jgi:hypothetical protein